MSLSVALATFNEQENIKRCLESVAGLANEVVIIDGGSKDKTVEVARRFGAKVFVTGNPAIFHINKQKAIDKCKNDWILQLDADEVVTEDLKKEIEGVINQPFAKSLTDGKSYKDKINGYWIPRKNWFLTRFLTKGGQYPDYTLRLYKKGKGWLPQKTVHEQAVVEGGTGYLENPLLHYPYKDFGQYLLKWNRYVDLLVDEIGVLLKNKNFMMRFVVFGFVYLLLRPIHWFFTTYIRHKGFVDGADGFLFSFFSALRFPVAYLRQIFKSLTK